MNEKTGLQYMQARWMMPELGRFLSSDPARDGLNWYVYCSNNPTTNIDPDGLEYFPSFVDNMESWYVQYFKEYSGLYYLGGKIDDRIKMQQKNVQDQADAKIQQPEINVLEMLDFGLNEFNYTAFSDYNIEYIPLSSYGNKINNNKKFIYGGNYSNTNNNDVVLTEFNSKDGSVNKDIDDNGQSYDMNADMFKDSLLDKAKKVSKLIPPFSGLGLAVQQLEANTDSLSALWMIFSGTDKDISSGQTLHNDHRFNFIWKNTTVRLAEAAYIWAIGTGPKVVENNITPESGKLYKPVGPPQSGGVKYSLRMSSNGKYKLVVDPKFETSVNVRTPSGKYNYVLTKDGKLILGNLKSGHSYLANSNSVRYAGEMQFTKGKLQWWSNASGHYMPDSNDAVNVVDILKNNNLIDATINNFIPYFE